MNYENPLPASRDYSSVLEPLDFVKGAWRGKWMIVSLGITGLALAALWVRFFPSEYVSRAVIRFIPPKVSERYVTTSGDAWAEQKTSALSQTLLSSLTARKMVEGAKLYPELRQFVTAADLVPRFQSALMVKSVAWRGGPGSRPVSSIEISFRYSDPAVAKQVVQQLVESVYENNERYRGDQSMSTAQFVSEQAESARQRLEELEDELGQLGRPDRISGDHEWALKIQNLYGVENRVGHVQASLRALRRDLADKVEEIEAVEGEIRRVPQSVTTSSELLTVEGARLRMMQNEAQLRFDLLTDHYTPSHPDLIDARKRLSDINEQLANQQVHDVEAARARAKRQLQSKLDLLRADRDSLHLSIRGQELEEATLTRKASELRAQAFSTKEADTDYLRLMREYTSLTEHYRGLYRKEQEAQIASEVDRQGQGEMVELLDPPAVPGKPEFPSSLVKLAAGAAGGMLAGLLLSIFRLQMRPTLRTAQHLRLWPGVVLLADLPGGSAARALESGRTGVSRWRPKLMGTIGSLILVVAAMLASAGCSNGPGGSAAAWLKAGAAAVRNGETDKAVRCYQNAIKLDARNGEAHEKLAELLIAGGEVEESLAHLIRAAELMPAKRQAQVALADLLYRVHCSDPGRSNGLLLELEEQGHRLMKGWPDRADGYRVMSLVLCERGRTEEAGELIRKGMERAGRQPELVTELASLTYRLGQREEAEELLRTLLDTGCRYGQAYDLLYLQLRDRKQPEKAGEVLRRKWEDLGEPEAGMQYAAHLDSVGARQEMIRQAEQVERRFGAKAETVALMAAFWASRGEHDRARRLYERGIADFAAHRSEFIGKLAELEVAAGKREKALEQIQAAILGSPKDSTLLAYRAALTLDTQNVEAQKAARLELELIMKRMPKSAFVRFHLGRSYMKLGDVFKAGKEFERCIRLDPNYAPGWLALAESEYRAGNVALSKSTLDTLLQRAPMYAGALLLRARVLHDLGQPKEVKRTLDLAAAAGASAQGLAIERARLRMSEGDSAEAVRLLEDAAKSAGNDPSLIVAIAWAETKSGGGEKGLARLNQAAKSNPDSLEIAEAKAELLTHMGRHDEARDVYAQLTRAVPQSPKYASGLADSLALTGRLKEAAVEYGRANAMPGAPAAVWVKAAAVHNALGNTSEAKAAYQAALARDGTNPYALNNLAYLLGRSGQQLDYALQLAQNAGQILPDNDEVQDTLLYVTLRMGLKHQALEILDRAAARSKSSAKAWYESLRAQLTTGTAEDVLRRMEDARRERRVS